MNRLPAEEHTQYQTKKINMPSAAHSTSREKLNAKMSPCMQSLLVKSFSFQKTQVFLTWNVDIDVSPRP